MHKLIIEEILDTKMTPAYMLFADSTAVVKGKECIYLNVDREHYTHYSGKWYETYNRCLELLSHQ